MHKACVDLCFATNQPRTYNLIFPFESLCMAQEIVATVQLPHPLVGIKTPNNQKTDYRIVNCPGGEGRVLNLPFDHHTTDTYRFEVAEVSEVANFDHNFY